MSDDTEFMQCYSRHRDMLELVEPEFERPSELNALYSKYYNMLNCIGLDNQCKVNFQELRRC